MNKASSSKTCRHTTSNNDLRTLEAMMIRENIMRGFYEMIVAVAATSAAKVDAKQRNKCWTISLLLHE
jgi:hypothetical protein